MAVTVDNELKIFVRENQFFFCTCNDNDNLKLNTNTQKCGNENTKDFRNE